MSVPCLHTKETGALENLNFCRPLEIPLWRIVSNIIKIEIKNMYVEMNGRFQNCNDLQFKSHINHDY